MGPDLAVREWIARPEFAAADWPAGDLSGRALPVAIALRIVHADNIVGLLTRVRPYGLEMDGGMYRVPSGVIRAYAILHGPHRSDDHRA